MRTVPRFSLILKVGAEVPCQDLMSERPLQTWSMESLTLEGTFGDPQSNPLLKPEQIAQGPPSNALSLSKDQQSSTTVGSLSQYLTILRVGKVLSYVCVQSFVFEFVPIPSFFTGHHPEQPDPVCFTLSHQVFMHSGYDATSSQG